MHCKGGEGVGEIVDQLLLLCSFVNLLPSLICLKMSKNDIIT